MRSIILVLGVGLATLGLTSTASAQCGCSSAPSYSYSYPSYSYSYPTYSYSYPANTPVYSYGSTLNTGSNWGGWNVYTAGSGNYDGGPRYVRYGNVIINRRRWGDLQNSVSYGDLIRW